VIFAGCTLTFTASSEVLTAITLDEGVSLARALTSQYERNAINVTLSTSPNKTVLEKLLRWAGFDDLVEETVDSAGEERRFIASGGASANGNLSRIKSMVNYLASWGIDVSAVAIDDDGDFHVVGAFHLNSMDNIGRIIPLG
jgi:hypothetical protein